MKRSGIRRKSELRADPGKAREFVQRGREAAARSLAASARAGAKKKAARREAEGPLSPGEWRAAVFESSGRRCIVTGTRAADVEDRRFHCHHVVPKDELRARGLGAHVWDPRNGVLVTERVHMLHEHAGGPHRISGARLPAAVWAFAQEMDATDGTSWATALVERLHPSH